MEGVLSESINQTLTHGPWATLSVAMVCGVVVFSILILKNFSQRKNGRCTNAELREDIAGLRQNITKIFDKLDILSQDIAKVRSEVSYLYGKMNGREK